MRVFLWLLVLFECIHSTQSKRSLHGPNERRDGSTQRYITTSKNKKKENGSFVANSMPEFFNHFQTSKDSPITSKLLGTAKKNVQNISKQVHESKKLQPSDPTEIQQNELNGNDRTVINLSNWSLTPQSAKLELHQKKFLKHMNYIKKRHKAKNIIRKVSKWQTNRNKLKPKKSGLESSHFQTLTNTNLILNYKKNMDIENINMPHRIKVEKNFEDHVGVIDMTSNDSKFHKFNGGEFSKEKRSGVWNEKGHEVNKEIIPHSLSIKITGKRNHIPSSSISDAFSSPRKRSKQSRSSKRYNIPFSRRMNMPMYSSTLSRPMQEDFMSYPSQYPELLSMQPLNKLYASAQNLDESEERILGKFLNKEKIEEENLETGDLTSHFHTADKENLAGDEIADLKDESALDKNAVSDISKTDQSLFKSIPKLKTNILKNTSNTVQSEITGAPLLHDLAPTSTKSESEKDLFKGALPETQVENTLAMLQGGKITESRLEKIASKINVDMTESELGKTSSELKNNDPSESNTENVSSKLINDEPNESQTSRNSSGVDTANFYQNKTFSDPNTQSQAIDSSHVESEKEETPSKLNGDATPEVQKVQPEINKDNMDDLVSIEKVDDHDALSTYHKPTDDQTGSIMEDKTANLMKINKTSSSGAADQFSNAKHFEQKKPTTEKIHAVRTQQIHKKIEQIKLLQEKLDTLKRLQNSRKKHLMMTAKKEESQAENLVEVDHTESEELPILKTFFRHKEDSTEKELLNRTGFQDGLYDRGRIYKWRHSDVAASKKEPPVHHVPVPPDGYFTRQHKISSFKVKDDLHSVKSLPNKTTTLNFDKGNDSVTGNGTEQTKEVVIALPTHTEKNLSYVFENDTKNSLSQTSQSQTQSVNVTNGTRHGFGRSMNEFKFNGKVNIDPSTYKGNVKIVHGPPPRDFLEAFGTPFPPTKVTTPFKAFFSLPPGHATIQPALPTFRAGFPWDWYKKQQKLRAGNENAKVAAVKQDKDVAAVRPTVRLPTNTQPPEVLTFDPTKPAPLAEDYFINVTRPLGNESSIKGPNKHLSSNNSSDGEVILQDGEDNPAVTTVEIDDNTTISNNSNFSSNDVDLSPDTFKNIATVLENGTRVQNTSDKLLEKSEEELPKNKTEEVQKGKSKEESAEDKLEENLKNENEKSKNKKDNKNKNKNKNTNKKDNKNPKQTKEASKVEESESTVLRNEPMFQTLKSRQVPLPNNENNEHHSLTEGKSTSHTTKEEIEAKPMMQIPKQINNINKGKQVKVDSFDTLRAAQAGVKDTNGKDSVTSKGSKRFYGGSQHSKTNLLSSHSPSHTNHVYFIKPGRKRIIEKTGKKRDFKYSSYILNEMKMENKTSGNDDDYLPEIILQEDTGDATSKVLERNTQAQGDSDPLNIDSIPLNVGDKTVKQRDGFINEDNDDDTTLPVVSRNSDTNSVTYKPQGTPEVVQENLLKEYQQLANLNKENTAKVESNTLENPETTSRSGFLPSDNEQSGHVQEQKGVSEPVTKSDSLGDESKTKVNSSSQLGASRPLASFISLAKDNEKSRTFQTQTESLQISTSASESNDGDDATHKMETGRTKSSVHSNPPTVDVETILPASKASESLHLVTAPPIKKQKQTSALTPPLSLDPTKAEASYLNAEALPKAAIAETTTIPSTNETKARGKPADPPSSHEIKSINKNEKASSELHHPTQSALMAVPSHHSDDDVSSEIDQPVPYLASEMDKTSDNVQESLHPETLQNPVASPTPPIVLSNQPDLVTAENALSNVHQKMPIAAAVPYGMLMPPDTSKAMLNGYQIQAKDETQKATLDENKTTAKSPFEDELNMEDMLWTDSSDEVESACRTQKGTNLVKQLMAFGDSLTRGYYNKGKNHHPYTTKLQYLMNKMDSKTCFIVENEGKDGDLAFGEMPKRINELLANSTKRFDWIIILGGTNDIYNKNHAGKHSAEEITKNILNVHDIAHHYGSRTVVVTIPDVECISSEMCLDMKQTRDSVNDNLRMYTLDHKEHAVLCDLADSLVRHKVSGRLVGQFFEGGLHLKPRGYETMAKLIFETLKPALDR